MAKQNKYCLPIPDAFSFEVRNPLGVSLSYIMFDSNDLNRLTFFTSHKKPVKNFEFFGDLTPAVISSFVKSNPLKIKELQIEFQDNFAAPSSNPQNIPTISFSNGNIDASQVTEPILFDSKRRNTQFQANLIPAKNIDRVIDSNTAMTFTLEPSNSITFTFFIEDILTCK